MGKVGFLLAFVLGALVLAGCGNAPPDSSRQGMADERTGGSQLLKSPDRADSGVLVEESTTGSEIAKATRTMETQAAAASAYIAASAVAKDAKVAAELLAVEANALEFASASAGTALGVAKQRTAASANADAIPTTVSKILTDYLVEGGSCGSVRDNPLESQMSSALEAMNLSDLQSYQALDKEAVALQASGYTGPAPMRLIETCVNSTGLRPVLFRTTQFAVAVCDAVRTDSEPDFYMLRLPALESKDVALALIEETATACAELAAGDPSHRYVSNGKRASEFFAAFVGKVSELELLARQTKFERLAATASEKRTAAEAASVEANRLEALALPNKAAYDQQVAAASRRRQLLEMQNAAEKRRRAQANEAELDECIREVAAADTQRQFTVMQYRVFCVQKKIDNEMRRKQGL